MTEPTTRRFRISFVLVAAAAAAAILVAGWALYTRFEQTNAARAANQRVWHAVICTIETKVVKAKIKPARKAELLRFYDGLLVTDVHTAGCGLQRPGRTR